MDQEQHYDLNGMSGERDWQPEIDVPSIAWAAPNEVDKLKVQEFLQIHHHQSFSMDYLSRYLDVPYLDVELHCAALVTEGCAMSPRYTHYVQGIPVDWAAVHAGRAEWPKWSVR